MILKQLFGPIRTIEQARNLARAGCLAVSLRALYAVVALFIFSPSGEEIVTRLQRMRGPVGYDDAAVDMIVFERIADTFFWLNVAGTLIVVAICAGLGLWQWRRPGTAMPVTGLCIMALTVAVTIWGLANTATRDIVLDGRNLVLLGLKPFLALLLVTAYRGGRYCQRYEKKLL